MDPQREYSLFNEAVHNLPYLVMVVLGMAILLFGFQSWKWAPIASASYALYGLLGAFWIIVFVCPHCRYYGTRSCPCGYGRLAAKLRRRQSDAHFAKAFKQNIAVIVPLWIIPVPAAAILLARQFAWLLLALLVAFLVDSFIVLPLVSKRHGCAHCPQRQHCPWMASSR